MVLINGVKYACERCIRGHRVTTCTHTDQPLTMIKPKGRPASQCQHCRDQRKLKNLHTSCTCGKKGKSPGMHLATCMCHKNSHCTCSSATPTSSSKSKSASNGNIHHLTASEKAKKKSLISAANTEIKRKVSLNNGSSSSNNSSPVNSTLKSAPTGSGLDNIAGGANDGYVIEDIAIPFDVSNGFFDLFSSPGSNDPYNNSVNGSSQNFNGSTQNFSNSTQNFNGSSQNFNDSTHSSVIKAMQGDRSTSSSPSIPNNSELINDLNSNRSLKVDMTGLDAPQFSPKELDLANNMFPLFPLVGSASFEDDRTQPLLSLPQSDDGTSSVEDTTRNFIDKKISSPTNLGRKNSNKRSSLSHMNPHQPKPLRPTPHSNLGSTVSSNSSYSNIQSSNLHAPPTSNNAMTTHASSHNHATTSSANSSTHYHPIRPKRPESVLSIASNSSNRSFDIGQNVQNPIYLSGTLPNASNSAAFPPSTNYSHYDLNGTYNSSTIGVSNSVVEDNTSELQHFGRSGLGSSTSSTNITPSIPPQKKEEYDILYYENLFSDGNPNTNNEALSSSSSFVNFFGASQAQSRQNNQLPPQQEEMNLFDLNFGQKQEQAPEAPIQPRLQDNKTSLDDFNDVTVGSGSIPPPQIPLDYELSIPMFNDFATSFDSKSPNDYKTSNDLQF